MTQTSGETLARRAAAGGTPLSFKALPSPVLAGVGLAPAVGVPPAGVVTGVGQLFTVGVTVGDFETVGVTVGLAGVGVTGGNVGVAVTGGRLTGVPCGPVGVGVPVCVLPGVVPGTGDELATTPLELAASRI